MNLTSAAQLKISKLIKQEQIALPNNKLFLRIAVQPGGCSGLRYQTFVFRFLCKYRQNVCSISSRGYT